MMKIVVGIDGSSASRAALRLALDDARLQGADVVAVGGWQPAVYPVGGLYGGITAQSPDLGPVIRARVQSVVDAIHTAGDPIPTIETGWGSTSELLITLATDADELVVGTRGRGGIASKVLGSVSHQLANHTPCPLIVVPAPDTPAEQPELPGDPPGRDAAAQNVIVVGVDGSPNSARALEWALARAEHTGAVVRVIHIWEEAQESQAEFIENEARLQLDQIVSAVEVPTGVVVQPILRRGAAASVLRDEMANANMLVVGARGRGGFLGLLLGSVARDCLNHTEHPVAIIPDVSIEHPGQLTNKQPR